MIVRLKANFEGREPGSVLRVRGGLGFRLIHDLGVADPAPELEAEAVAYTEPPPPEPTGLAKVAETIKTVVGEIPKAGRRQWRR